MSCPTYNHSCQRPDQQKVGPGPDRLVSGNSDGSEPLTPRSHADQEVTAALEHFQRMIDHLTWLSMPTSPPLSTEPCECMDEAHRRYNVAKNFVKASAEIATSDIDNYKSYMYLQVDSSTTSAVGSACEKMRIDMRVKSMKASVTHWRCESLRELKSSYEAVLEQCMIARLSRLEGYRFYY